MIKKEKIKEEIKRSCIKKGVNKREKGEEYIKIV